MHDSQLRAYALQLRRRKNLAAQDTKKASKYGAKGEKIDDIYFASKAEGERYRQLKNLESTGTIINLELQPTYRCMVKNEHITTYRADFRYRLKSGATVVEDVKGVRTQLYSLKKKLVEALFGLRLVEVPASQVASWSGRVGS